MSTASYVLEAPDSRHLLNANQRIHWAKRAQRTRYWRDHAAWAVKRSSNAPHFTSAHVTVAIRFPTNHRRDIGNYYPTAKALVDGLVDAGILPDDNDTVITGPDLRRELPNGPLRVTVTLDGQTGERP